MMGGQRQIVVKCPDGHSDWELSNIEDLPDAGAAGDDALWVLQLACCR